MHKTFVAAVAVSLGLALMACGSSSSSNAASSSEPAQTAAASATSPSVGATPPVPAGSDPQSVVQKYVDAMDRGDPVAAIALFTPDATFQTPLGGCTPCTGRASFQDRLVRAAAPQTTITISQVTVDGDTVNGHAERRSPHVPAGVPRAIGPFTVVVRNGEITSLKQDSDLTDPQTAALFSALNGTPPSP